MKILMNPEKWVERVWYGHSLWRWVLWPLSLLYRLFVTHKRRRWLAKPRQSYHANVPLIVVGNLSVGGTGKTPLVLKLIDMARDLGLAPGVISRGYGGNAPAYPCAVEDYPEAAIVGDEPLLIWRRSRCPVVVAPRRAEAAALLISRFSPDIIFSDDGLQHYALGRDFEIVVVDGKRQFGNTLCLPAGPLREPLERLRSVDLVVGNGCAVAGSPYFFRIAAGQFVALGDGKRQDGSAWIGTGCVAVAGIGNPERFFQTLRELGLAIEPHAFPDHYQFSREDFSAFAGRPVLMTEKDAVKCGGLGLNNAWYLEVEAQMNPALTQAMTTLLTDRSTSFG
jgi:tetraacyldisaccharide 4'-kinase